VTTKQLPFSKSAAQQMREAAYVAASALVQRAHRTHIFTLEAMIQLYQRDLWRTCVAYQNKLSVSAGNSGHFTHVIDSLTTDLNRVGQRYIEKAANLGYARGVEALYLSKWIVRYDSPIVAPHSIISAAITENHAYLTKSLGTDLKTAMAAVYKPELVPAALASFRSRIKLYGHFLWRVAERSYKACLHEFDTFHKRTRGLRENYVDDAAAVADRNPSKAQITAGNYRKGHTEVFGIPISIENAKGSIRRGVGEDGKPWEAELPAHYGYVKRTVGADDDQVDVFIGPDPNSLYVYVIDQCHKGEFDEHKAMLGFAHLDVALKTYRAAFSDNIDRIGAVKTMTIDGFKAWLKQGDTKNPIAMREAGPPDEARDDHGRWSTEGPSHDLLAKWVLKSADHARYDAEIQKAATPEYRERVAKAFDDNHPDGATLYRGITGQAAQDIKSLKKGALLPDSSTLTSSSSSEQIAQYYVYSPLNAPTIPTKTVVVYEDVHGANVIASAESSPIVFSSAVSRSQEVVLDPKTQWQITDKYQSFITDERPERYGKTYPTTYVHVKAVGLREAGPPDEARDDHGRWTGEIIGGTLDFEGKLYHATEDAHFKLEDTKGDGFLGRGLYLSGYKPSEHNAYGDYVHTFTVKAKLLDFSSDREYETAVNVFKSESAFRSAMQSRGFEGLRVERGIPPHIPVGVYVLWSPTKTTTELREAGPTDEARDNHGRWTIGGDWERNSYTKGGKVDLVPISFFQRFKGNQLGKTSIEDLKADLSNNGLNEPAIMSFGQKDRTISSAEGNHRAEALKQLGYTHIPVRMIRMQNANGIPFDDMSKVPVNDYFKGDAAPHEVFDDFDAIGGIRRLKEGGAGSGNWDHAGRIGQVGGSAASSGTIQAMRKIAQMHDEAKDDPNNPKTKATYSAFIKQVNQQYVDLRNRGYRFEFGKDDPYKDSQDMTRDVDQNHRLKVYNVVDLPDGHPLAAMSPFDGQTENTIFRAVHDMYGHYFPGNTFGQRGELKAYQAHAAMFDNAALPALASETLAQNAWVNHAESNETLAVQDRPFAPQKAYAFDLGVARAVRDSKFPRIRLTESEANSGFITLDFDELDHTDFRRGRCA
jgi:hypothetical protein